MLFGQDAVPWMQTIWPWVFFNGFVFFLLALDLGVFHRQAHEVKIREALSWSAVWIAISMIFAAGIFQFHPRGREAGIEFLSGYALEKMLSVDNLFVFVLIFSYFHVPRNYQHKVLFWGILGALIMRATFIFVGQIMISRFGHYVFPAFGAFLIYTGVKLLGHDNEEIHPEHNPFLRMVRKIFRLTKDYEGSRFFVRHAGKLFATPLFLVLVMVETTDVLFAVDSIPAIFGVTQDTFIVYTSNVFAILGLRALFFALSGLLPLFRFLNYGLSLILVFIGLKMIAHGMGWFEIRPEISLVLVVIILATSIGASLLFKVNEDATLPNIDFDEKDAHAPEIAGITTDDAPDAP